MGAGAHDYAEHRGTRDHAGQWGTGRPRRTGATQPVAAAGRGRRSKGAGGRLATLVTAQGTGGPGRASATQPVAAVERGHRSKAAGGHSPDGHVGAGAHDCPHEHGGTRDHAEQRGTGQPGRTGATQPVAAAERGRRSKAAGGRVATLVAAQGAGGPGRAGATQPVAATERGRRSKVAGGHSPDGHVGAGAHDCPHEHGGTRDHAGQRGTGQPRHAGAAQPVATVGLGRRPKDAGPLKNGSAGHHGPT